MTEKKNEPAIWHGPHGPILCLRVVHRRERRTDLQVRRPPSPREMVREKEQLLSERQQLLSEREQLLSVSEREREQFQEVLSGARELLAALAAERAHTKETQ